MAQINTPDPSKFTVSGQMDGLLQAGNPYMKQAATAGQQYANKRGLLNSSIGAGASQAAAIEAAMPIAQQDAKAYTDMTMQNAAFRKDVAMENLKQNSGMYAHFLQGMSEVNASDMDQAAKDKAMSSLWSAINTGTKMSASLSKYTTDNIGNMIYNVVDTPVNR